MSIVEAMFLGLPCAISENLDMANLFHERNIGFLLSEDPIQISRQLKEIFRNPSVLKEISIASRKFARFYFDPSYVANQYLQLYEEVIKH